MIGTALLWPFLRGRAREALTGLPQTVVARVPVPGGAVTVRRWHLARSSFVPDESGGTALRVTHDDGVGLFTGADAERAAARLLPAVNRFAGTHEDVELALSRLDAVGDARRYVAAFARNTGRRTAVAHWRRGPGVPADEEEQEHGLNALPASASLALEMALHEETERRAMEGELAELERAWRAAEEIAAIADDLLVPASVRHALARLRGHTPG